ncbi:MAG: Mut7-C ubiquitin/RNAse domain-containing protein [Nitrosomonas sp.]|nr:Mut7-C ubiquitin/RNAse domain-containing protein [Nitrosomonas sp.]OQW84287.1 MAG: twitching motility protein PilT [Proteobacteria bacterium ST_bin16]
MAQIGIRFYHSLNDFLASGQGDTEIIHNFERKASIKDMIESFNVPHPEVERISVNGIAVDFNYTVRDGDHIEVFPWSEDFNGIPVLRLRAELSQPPLFVVDSNLGRLARYLRLLGFDCLYRNDYDDGAVAKIASEQRRVVLTRDRSLLKRRIITHGYFVRADRPKIQTREVLKRFALYSLIRPLTRCTQCNGILTETGKKPIEHRLEPLTKRYYDKFLICPECDRIYWQGSHTMRIKQLLDEFVNEKS